MFSPNIALIRVVGVSHLIFPADILPTMFTALLYLMITLIWGTTWLAIQYQIGVVSPLWSVAYRFGIASILLIVFCLIRGESLRFSKREHLTIAVQGVCLFSANCVLFYLGSQYLLSGMMALIFSNVMLMNAINERLIFKTPLTARILLAGFLGVLGLALVFSSEISHLQNLNANNHHQGHITYGIILTLLATLIASIGSLFAAYNRKKQLPLFSSNAIGMCYGTLLTAILAIATGQPLHFSLAPSYLLSLAHLALFGSLTAYVAYVALIGRIGPTKAAYVFVCAPIIALIVSTIFEGFYWTFATYLGVGSVLLGNLLAMLKSKAKHQPRSVPPSQESI